MAGKKCRALSRDEALAIFRSFSGKFAVRDRAVFALGLSTGFRISELLSARLGDVVRDGEILDELTLREQKTGKIRSVPLGEQAKMSLRPWLEELKRREFVLADCWLFCKSSGGKLPYKRFLETLHAAAEKAGVRGRLGTHSMRKTFAREMLQIFKASSEGDDGSALVKIQCALGHSRMDSTVHYVNNDAEKVSKEIKRYNDEVYLWAEKKV